MSEILQIVFLEEYVVLGDLHVPADDMASGVGDQARGTGLDMCPDAQLIAHCSTYHEYARLFTHQVGYILLQVICSRVLMEDVIKQGRCCCSIEHGGCR